jgi:ATP-dependent DNA helicase RecG
MERVKAVAATNDGFKLSEIDLELRREGDVLGSTQSGGRSSLKLLRVLRDQELIQRVRGQVQAIYDQDPTLEKHLNLANALLAQDKANGDFLTKS